MKQITKDKIKYGLIAVAFILMIGIGIGVAGATEPPKQCPRDVVATPEPGLPDGAILYQVYKIYCVNGRAWMRGLDKVSSPMPRPMGQSCDMSKPFVLRVAGGNV